MALKLCEVSILHAGSSGLILPAILLVTRVGPAERGQRGINALNQDLTIAIMRCSVPYNHDVEATIRSRKSIQFVRRANQHSGWAAQHRQTFAGGLVCAKRAHLVEPSTVHTLEENHAPTSVSSRKLIPTSVKFYCGDDVRCSSARENRSG